MLRPIRVRVRVRGRGSFVMRPKLLLAFLLTIRLKVLDSKRLGGLEAKRLRKFANEQLVPKTTPKVYPITYTPPPYMAHL